MQLGLGKSENQSDETGGAAEGLREDEGAPSGGDDSDRMAFRPSFLDEQEGRRDSGSQSTPPPPSGDTFFLVVKRAGGSENHRFDDPVEAQTFVEQLLEEGVPENDITAFSGHRLGLRVRHRPVVHLASA